MLVFLLLSSLISAAHAEETVIPMPSYGVNVIIGDDCSVKAVGHVPAAKAGELAEKFGAVESRCLSDKARRDDKARADKKATARSASEDKLLEAGAELVKKGGSIDYSAKADGDIRFVSGPAAETRAAVEAYGQISGVGGMVDMTAFRRVQARVGFALPQAQTISPPPAASAVSADLDECKEALKAKAELIDQLSGS